MQYEELAHSMSPGPMRDDTMQKVTALWRLLDMNGRALFLMDLMQLNIDITGVYKKSSETQSVAELMVEEGVIPQVSNQLEKEMERLRNIYS